MFYRFLIVTLLLSLALNPSGGKPILAAAPATYYISSSSGSDANNGLSTSSSFATISKINSLNLQPGDRVLLKCGDTWRADPLILSKSGSAAAWIEFNSYPSGCSNKPALSGSRAISGWALESGNIYYSDLTINDFPLGINQLFRNGQRLTLGRWPNLNASNAGYSFVDTHTSGSSQITDNELPAGNWAGAVLHIKNIRWSMLDRQVTGSGSHSLSLNQGFSCLVSGWGTCQGWGYFLNNSRNTLDQDGEWFYDSSTRRVYLYSTIGSPVDIEGSVILSAANDIRDGGVMLSNGASTSYIILDNLSIKNWFNHGIGTPGGMNGDIYHHITMHNLVIQDVNAAGVNLSSWLERPSNARKGLRGGNNLIFLKNVVDGANSFGITGYFAESTFENNTIQNIALIKNLGQSGMGCGFTSGECTENGDGIRIRTYDVRDSGYSNTLRQNTLVKIGYNGVDVFGPETLLENNVITHACYSKADCGAVRVFGGDSLSTTPVYNIHLVNNIIADIPGNVDGCEASRAAFGMGLYIDHYSRDVEVRGNTVINTTVSGILFQQSTGQAVGNTVFNASSGTEYSAQVDLSGSQTRVILSGNALYALKTNAWTVYAGELANIISSDQNYIFHPYVNKHIAFGPSWTRNTFSEWQAFSGQDQHSKTNWFTQPIGEASRAVIFHNPTLASKTFTLSDRQYLDLDQKPVVASLTLQPFASKILIDNGPAPLTLSGIHPSLSEVSKAASFILTVSGTGFSSASVVRWNGSDRPTTFVDSSHLTASISAADVGTLGAYPITIRDSAALTPALMYHVVTQIYNIYLPSAYR